MTMESKNEIYRKVAAYVLGKPEQKVTIGELCSVENSVCNLLKREECGFDDYVKAAEFALT